jgi:hypothetical protein
MGNEKEEKIERGEKKMICASVCSHGCLDYV